MKLPSEAGHQAKGLQSFLNLSTKFMYFVKMVNGLVFVPPDQVGDIFDTVLMDYLYSHRQEKGLEDFAEELEDFVSYLQRTWIGIVAGRNRTAGSLCLLCQHGTNTRISSVTSRSPTTAVRVRNNNPIY